MAPRPEDDLEHLDRIHSRLDYRVSHWKIPEIIEQIASSGDPKLANAEIKILFDNYIYKSIDSYIDEENLPLFFVLLEHELAGVLIDQMSRNRWLVDIWVSKGPSGLVTDDKRQRKERGVVTRHALWGIKAIWCQLGGRDEHIPFLPETAMNNVWKKSGQNYKVLLGWMEIFFHAMRNQTLSDQWKLEVSPGWIARAFHDLTADYRAYHWIQKNLERPLSLAFHLCKDGVEKFSRHKPLADVDDADLLWLLNFERHTDNTQLVWSFIALAALFSCKAGSLDSNGQERIDKPQLPYIDAE